MGDKIVNEDVDLRINLLLFLIIYLFIYFTLTHISKLFYQIHSIYDLLKVYY